MKLSSRITALLLCMAMVLTSAWNENLMVLAAADSYYGEDQESVGETNLVSGAFADSETLEAAINGDQSTWWIWRSQASVEVQEVEGQNALKFTFSDGNWGANYNNGLKYTGTYGDSNATTLENGKTYQISFKVKSTIDRTIASCFDAYQAADESKWTTLVANEETTVTQTVTLGGAWNNYFIYLGGVNGADEMQAHEVTVWDFTVKEVSVVSASGDVVEETVGNLITNGTFAEGTQTGWDMRAEGSVQVVPYRAIFDITNGTGLDYNTWMIQNNVILEASKTYKIRFDVVSSIDRRLTAGFEGGMGRLASKAVVANEKTTLEWEVSGITGGNFAIYLGANIENQESQTLEAHRVSISNVRIVDSEAERNNAPASEAEIQELQSKYEAASAKKEAGGASYTEDSWTNFVNMIDAAKVILDKAGATFGEVSTALANLKAAEAGLVEIIEETEGNLLTNGTFATGTLDGWSVNSGYATVTALPYRVVFDITQDCADWQNWLTQPNVTLDAGSKYELKFDIVSSVDRYITAGFDPNFFEAKEVKADEKTTITYEISNSQGGSFNICLGSNIRDINGAGAINQTLGAHQVVISNVRLVQLPVDLSGADTENDEYPEALTDLSTVSGYAPSDLTVIKNGTFASGLANWETFAEQWMLQYDVVSFEQTEKGMQVNVGNTGDGEGNKAWDVQLNQNINLKKDLQYTLSFKLTSNKARSINVSIADINNGEAWVKTIGVQKGEAREVVLNLPVLAEDAVGKLFSFQLGKVNDFGVTDNTLLFEDVKIEVHGYQALAERITDGDFDGTEIGTFVFDGNEKANVTVEDSVRIDIAEACHAEEVTLTKAGLDLLAGQTYRFSFVAGDVQEQAITVNVKGSDSSVKKTENYTLSNDATEHYFTYTPSTNETVSLEFAVGGIANTVCLDNIRCDISGYAEAAGVDTSAHDITALDKYPAPVISEADAAAAYEGQNIVLTYENNAAYTAAIDSVVVGDTNVFGTANCVITEGATKTTITLNSSLFAVDGDSEIFEIKIGAYWYENVKVLQTVYKNQAWTESWYEEFDGDALDSDKWSYQNGNGAEYGVPGWGNEEQQYYTDENISVGDGKLTILAKKDNSKGTKYTSGRIWTMNDNQETAKFSQKYGRMEAKIKVPGGEGYEGIWPAFWMLPVDTSVYGGWPLSGEIDIMEIRGRLPDEVAGTIHYGKPYPNNQNSGELFKFSESTYNTDSDVNDYHIYAVEWEPTEIRWYVDGELYCTRNNWYSQASDKPSQYAYPAPFDQEFYIILNMAVGGTFDGKLEPSDKNLPAEMVVDYVRVYESTEPYDTDLTEPEIEKDTSVDINTVKSSFIDSEFENVTVVKDNNTAQDPDGWNFVTLPNFGGVASLKTVTEGDETLAKIDITNTGSAAHSVQLIQNVSLVKGYCYKLSFDAKAEANRGMSIKFGDMGDSGWGVYSTFEANLGKNLQHYEYVFQMRSNTDLTSRIEFNLGMSSKTAYIGNITLEIVEDASVNPDVSKPALFDDNQIYNGAFDLGDAARLAYWHVTGDGAVERVTDALNAFKATNGTLYQKGIQLLQSDSYKLTFNTDAEAAKKITVTVKSEDGTVYKTQEINVAAGEGQQEVTFTMEEEVTDLNAIVEFAFETSADAVSVSNIMLVKTSYNNEDWDSLNAYPLKNGDFELGTNGWNQHGGANFTVIEEVENTTNHVAQVNGLNGGNAWDNMLIYEGLDLAGGYTYEFAFDVWADSEQEIVVTMDDASYNAYFSQSNIAVGPEKTRYTYTFKLALDQNLALKFQFGKGNGAYTAYVDNVTLNMKGAPAAPGGVGVNAYNRLGEDVVLTLTGEDAWKEAIKVYVGSNKIDSELITVVDNTLTIDKSVFAKEGSYELTFKANGYAQTSATVTIYPANGNHLLNGGFQNVEDAMANWGHWEMNESGTVAAKDGKLEVNYYYGAQENAAYVPYSILFTQENIPVESGKTYRISFLAKATIDRPIMVTRDQGAEIHEYVDITTEEKAYTVTFTATSDVLKLVFQVGTVGSEEQYNAANAFDPHTMYFDSISVREVVEGEDDLYTEDLTALIATVEAMTQGNYNDASWANLQAVLTTVKNSMAAAENQPQVDSLKDDLQEAFDKLVAYDTSALNELVTTASAYDEAKYTEETWASLETALAAAKAVLDDTANRDQTKVDDALAKLRKAVSELKEKAVLNTTELAALITAVEAMTKGNYTDETWNNLQTVLQTVKASMATAVTQLEIDGLKATLQNAVDQLKEKEVINNTELNTLIAEAEAMTQGDYTDASWTNFQTVLTEVKAALATATTQAQIDALKAKLQTAINGLEKKQPKVGIWAETIPDQEYTGKAIKVQPTVYDGETLLKLNRDYTLKYNSNTNVGEATITIKGKGNYSGNHTVKFNIVANDITTEGAPIYVVLPKDNKMKQVKPSVTTIIAGKTQKVPASKYTLSWNYDNKAAFDQNVADTTGYTVTATIKDGEKNYKGSITYPVIFVTAKTQLIKNAKISLEYNKTAYTGTALEPAVTVKVSGKDVDKTWYTVAYDRNTYVGKATVTVTGDNKNLFGQKTLTFTITGESLSKVAEITGLAETVDYTGEAHEPTLQLKLKGSDNLIDPAYYDVTYKNNVKAGKATVTVTGKDAYSGKLTKTFTIGKVDVNNKDKVQITYDAKAAYSKAGAKVTNLVVKCGDKLLQEKVDYKITYANNKKPGAEATIKITGLGGYTGTYPGTFTVEKADFANVIVTTKDAAEGTKYNKLKVTLTDGGKKLAKNEYTLTYQVNGVDMDPNAKTEENTTVTVIATPKSDSYTEGTKAIGTLHVGKAKHDIAKAKVTLKTTKNYTGEEVTLTESDLKVVVKGVELTSDQYKIVAHGGDRINKGSKATVTIIGLGDYYGSKTTKFAIGQKDIPQNLYQGVANVLNYLKDIF